MKSITPHLLLAAACALCLAASERPLHLFMAGDSTMANKTLFRPAPDPVTGEMTPEVWHERGWGQLLPEFFGDNIVIDNMAKNGRSTRSFITEGSWQRLVDKLHAGDHVVIQFGHNDEPVEKKSHTTPDEYRRNLERFVDDVKAKGAVPVLCTPVPRRRFEDKGDFIDSHGTYLDIVCGVARERGAVLVDLYESTKKMLLDAGEKNSARYFWHLAPGVNRHFPDGLVDNTHFSEAGARGVAALFVQEIKRQGIAPLVDRLKESEPPYRSAVWVADLGNGKYKNPVLHADYSDPDVCRVGDDYYMTSSSFNCVPGLPILHSNDLVNWTLVGHALPRQEPAERFDAPRHGDGVWAPAIRHRDGKFYIYYGDPDQGIFMTTSRDPRGGWSAPLLVKAGKGLIDPCPLWDDDGQAYLVHAFAGSRAGIKSLLAITRLSPDGKRVVGDSRVIYDGHDVDETIEGPKFYKRDGYYYIFAPAGGVTGGWQVALRSKNLFGPYERKVILARGNTAINGPHQGAWVETGKGEGWFLHFQDAGPRGRLVHLQPLAWRDGWPLVGEDPDGDGVGQPVASWSVPATGKRYPVATPVESDEFNTGTLGLQWQWHANPREWWYFADAAGGHLSLYSVPLPGGYRNLWDAPNLLLQKLPAPAFTATARVTFKPDPRRDGERAGLVVMGADYALLTIRSAGGSLALVQEECRGADKGGAERENASIALDGPTLYLRVRVRPDDTCLFSYSVDGKRFTTIGKPFAMKAGRWIGAKFGFFCSRPAESNDGGRLDVDWIRVNDE
ncbi:MAG: family 43 glycosylhydrolase [Odoribacteraceae bacterium]|jgi:beta-xylosidase/lysophospholipase L1-like esterase|nr:family 43 glycosylhydrolase [Odoribacteraceae bacterium]